MEFHHVLHDAMSIKSCVPDCSCIVGYDRDSEAKAREKALNPLIGTLWNPYTNPLRIVSPLNPKP